MRITISCFTNSVFCSELILIGFEKKCNNKVSERACMALGMQVLPFGLATKIKVLPCALPAYSLSLFPIFSGTSEPRFVTTNTATSIASFWNIKPHTKDQNQWKKMLINAGPIKSMRAAPAQGTFPGGLPLTTSSMCVCVCICACALVRICTYLLHLIAIQTEILPILNLLAKIYVQFVFTLDIW